MTKAFTFLKDNGFRNILVVDDNSTDGTNEEASKAGAQVIRNKVRMGFNHSLLKGLYHIKTPGVFIMVEPGAKVDIAALDNFLEYGVIGDYPILLSRGRPKEGVNFSKILKRQYGLYLMEPGFQGVYLNGRMLEIIKDKVAGGSPNLYQYIYFEIIKAALENKAKIGVLDSGIDESEYRGPYYWRWRYRRIRAHRSYINQAFPNLAQREMTRKILLGLVVTGLGGALATLLAAIALSFKS